MMSMKKIIGLAILAGAAFAGSANAETTYSGNVALTTDYSFRGISQTSNDPAVQGGFDVGMDQFYVGTWASALTSNTAAGGPIELDLYGGWKPTVGPFALDLGVLGYFYPDASDDAAETNYYELKAAATIAPTEGWSITGSVFYSPDFFGETDTGLYYELATSFALTPSLSLSGAVGNQSIDDVNGPLPGAVDDNYTTWNIGATYTVAGFSFDLRYVDTDLEATDPIASTFIVPPPGQTGADIADGRAIFTIKRAL